MNKEFIIQRLFEATKIPLQLFDSERKILTFENSWFEPNPASLIFQKTLSSGKSVCYTFTPEYLFCGLVRIQNSSEYLIVGPVMPMECSKRQAQIILGRMHLPFERTAEFLSWFHGIPQCDIHRFQGFLKLIDYSLNQNEQADVVQIPYIETLFDLSAYHSEPKFIDHIDDTLEKELLSCVGFGKVKDMENILRNLAFNVYGVPEITPNIIRSFKNVLIFSNALASRTAISGGLDYDTALAIANNYMIQVETLDNNTDIFLLLKQMFLDYTHRVAKSHSLETHSILVNKITKEISSHLYEKITPTLIARHLNMNCAYLCSHFKKETGKTITEYINEVKIKESMRLLTATNMSIIHISTQLGFNSQNYFHSVFRKVTGMTPMEYRNKTILR